ncbi:hypothetical protein M758_UG228100 [Ceratodon purpureus]|nr:hypothetical protein M758_UG228100 [Ceratodon purpureus]
MASLREKEYRPVIKATVPWFHQEHGLNDKGFVPGIRFGEKGWMNLIIASEGDCLRRWGKKTAGGFKSLAEAGAKALGCATGSRNSTKQHTNTLFHAQRLSGLLSLVASLRRRRDIWLIGRTSLTSSAIGGSATSRTGSANFRRAQGLHQ